ncbi:uracil-DNA glycosylase family protein [Roseomonas chloroacetimidivorans]|uniref:uracil-DNA glycosylase family protein n=1 Tax=Roseomonas chloroacetimidivorans TaxID=1766656 RepID=UPI003C78BA9C
MTWARDEARIAPDAFACQHYEDCNRSVGGTLGPGTGCQMSYVGQHYAPEEDPADFRLVVVGMDHGEKSCAGYEATRDGLDAVYQEGGKNFNPHYKGVVRTAIAIFGDGATYCRANCGSRCTGGSQQDTATACVINRIVQPNVVKCTPDTQDDRRSRATWQMWRNCAHHLAHELQLLRPHLVVFHGSWAPEAVLGALTAEGAGAAPVEGAPRAGARDVLYRSPALGTHLLFLYHPSYGHLDRQWDPVVEPCLAFLRERELIPSRAAAT